MYSEIETTLARATSFNGLVFGSGVVCGSLCAIGSIIAQVLFKKGDFILKLRE
jgi:hypothetical protein